MKQSDCLSVNRQGHLTIGGCDTVELAKEYGTPLSWMKQGSETPAKATAAR